MKKSSTRLNWRTYLPADEREYELYSLAYRRSYSFLVGVLFAVFGVYKMATITDALPSNLIYIFLLIYVLIGFVLAEFVGSRVFVGQDVSFSKKREAFKLVEGTWGGSLLLLGYLVVVLSVLYWLATHLK